MVGMLGYISSSDIRYLIVIAPIHAVGYYLCSKEPLFIDLFKVKLEKCSKSRNKIYHGANSYDAF
jgi:type IV secretion system protein VirB3